MRITKSKLKNIIQEELQNMLYEATEYSKRYLAGELSAAGELKPKPKPPAKGTWAYAARPGPAKPTTAAAPTAKKRKTTTVPSISRQGIATMTGQPSRQDIATMTGPGQPTPATPTTQSAVAPSTGFKKGEKKAPFSVKALETAAAGGAGTAAKATTYGAQPPKRVAGMSTKYLQKRGYAWDPTKGTMMHKTKGDVRDVAKAWRARKGSKGKTKQSDLGGLLAGKTAATKGKRSSKVARTRRSFRPPDVTTSKAGAPTEPAVPGEQPERAGPTSAQRTFDPSTLTGKMTKSPAQQKIDKISDPAVRKSVQQKYDQRQAVRSAKRTKFEKTHPSSVRTTTAKDVAGWKAKLPGLKAKRAEKEARAREEKEVERGTGGGRRFTTRQRTRGV